MFKRSLTLPYFDCREKKIKRKERERLYNTILSKNLNTESLNSFSPPSDCITEINGLQEETEWVYVHSLK